MKRERYGSVLVALSAVAFGFLAIFAKMAYGAGISTYTLLFLRFTVAALFMFSLMRIRKCPLPSKKEIISFLLLGALGYVGQSTCYLLSVEYSSAGTATLLLYLHPALVMLFSALLYKEKITVRKVIALFLALSGAFIIIGGTLEASPKGIILGVAAAFIYSFYLLFNSRLVKEGMGIQSSAFIMLGAAVVFGIINIFTGFTVPTHINGYVAVVLTALFSTVFAMWALLTGMEITGPTKATLISVLEPVVTVVMSVLILSEPLTLNILLGGSLVVGALFVQSLKTEGV